MLLIRSATLLAAVLLVGATRLTTAQPESTSTVSVSKPANDDDFGMPAERQNTSATSETVTDRFQPAPRPRQVEAGKVAATAAGGLGGATSYTQTMPLDVDGLIKLRIPFTNRPEFRGAWVTRFDWAGRGSRGTTDTQVLKDRITKYMSSAQGVGLNAILFQVRGDATTLYPSKLEPWSRMIGGKDPGFDPVEFAISEAHRHGLEFHAYMNPGPCTEEKTTAPASKDHIFYKHCMPDSSPNWLVFSGGKPAPYNEYRWLNLNLPEVQQYLRTVLLDFISRYDIDGVHFDRIRFPSNDVSDDKWSKARFEKTNPDKLTYAQWQAENITRMLTDVYTAMSEIKPHVKVSSSVWGIYDHTKLPQGNDKATGYSWTSSGLQDYMQDSVGWANRGCMDALVPMIYWNMGDLKPDYDELLLSFMTDVRNGRHVYGGLRVFGKEEMIRQVTATNLIGGQGTVPFTLNRITDPEMAEFYRKHINPSHVPVPDMPWKSRPTFGHALITVLDNNGKPVTDAMVKAAGHGVTTFSSTDGVCGLLNLTPGEITVHAEKAGAGKASATAQVYRGKVTRVEIKLKP